MNVVYSDNAGGGTGSIQQHVWGEWATSSASIIDDTSGCYTQYQHDTTTTSNAWTGWCVDQTKGNVTVRVNADINSAQTKVWGFWVTSGGSSSSTPTGQYPQEAYDAAWGNWTIEHHDSISTVERRPVEGYERLEDIEAYHNRDTQHEQRCKAEEVAKELLMELIGPKELEEYNRTGKLFVQGKKYGYIVQKEGFVHRIEKDQITRLCVHLEDRFKYPATDNVIAMMLALKTDEKRILDIANEHGHIELPEEFEAACLNQLPI